MKPSRLTTLKSVVLLVVSVVSLSASSVIQEGTPYGC